MCSGRSGSLVDMKPVDYDDGGGGGDCEDCSDSCSHSMELETIWMRPRKKRRMSRRLFDKFLKDRQRLWPKSSPY